MKITVWLIPTRQRFDNCLLKKFNYMILCNFLKLVLFTIETFISSHFCRGTFYIIFIKINHKTNSIKYRLSFLLITEIIQIFSTKIEFVIIHSLDKTARLARVNTFRFVWLRALILFFDFTRSRFFFGILRPVPKTRNFSGATTFSSLYHNIVSCS
jgi:hypothetical protein